MIQFINVTKRYGAGHEALCRVNFYVQTGEMVFLTGHSGAGKSTLLKLMMRVERPTQGQVIVAGRNLGRLPDRHLPALRRDIGVIFQDAQLLPGRTVFENVAMPLTVVGYRREEIERRVCAALERVGLSRQVRCFPRELSGGEQQRASIARAIVHRPALLLADEPTGNLDPDLAAEIMRFFAQLNQVGVTMLIATHNLALIAPLHYRLLTLKQGVLVDHESL